MLPRLLALMSAFTALVKAGPLPLVLRDTAAPFMASSCITAPAAINWNGATDRSCNGPSSSSAAFCNTGTAGNVLPAPACCATGEAGMVVLRFSVVFKRLAAVRCLLVQDMKKYLVVAS